MRSFPCWYGFTIWSVPWETKNHMNPSSEFENEAMKTDNFQYPRTLKIQNPKFRIQNFEPFQLRAKNAFPPCSSPTLVSGPWPGQRIVFAGSVRICSMLFFNASG